MGATLSGVAAACRALGCRKRDVLTGTSTLRTEPCEPTEDARVEAPLPPAAIVEDAPAEAVYA